MHDNIKFIQITCDMPESPQSAPLPPVLKASYLREQIPGLIGIVCRNVGYERDVDFPKSSFSGTKSIIQNCSVRDHHHGSLIDISHDLLKANIPPSLISMYALRDWGLNPPDAMPLVRMDET